MAKQLSLTSMTAWVIITIIAIVGPKVLKKGLTLAGQSALSQQIP